MSQAINHQGYQIQRSDLFHNEGSNEFTVKSSAQANGNLEEKERAREEGKGGEGKQQVAEQAATGSVERRRNTTGQRRNKEQRKAESKSRKQSVNNDDNRKQEDSNNGDIYSKSPAKIQETFVTNKTSELTISNKKKSQRQGHNQHNFALKSPKEDKRPKRHHVKKLSSNVSHFQHLIREGRKSVFNSQNDGSQSDKHSPVKSARNYRSQEKVSNESENKGKPLSPLKLVTIPDEPMQIHPSSNKKSKLSPHVQDKSDAITYEDQRSGSVNSVDEMLSSVGSQERRGNGSEEGNRTPEPKRSLEVNFTREVKINIVERNNDNNSPEYSEKSENANGNGGDQTPKLQDMIRPAPVLNSEIVRTEGLQIFNGGNNVDQRQFETAQMPTERLINTFYRDDQLQYTCKQNQIIHTIEELDEKLEMESTPCNTNGGNGNNNGPIVSPATKKLIVVNSPMQIEGKSTSSCPTDHQSPIPSQQTPLHQLKHGINNYPEMVRQQHLESEWAARNECMPASTGNSPVDYQLKQMQDLHLQQRISLLSKQLQYSQNQYYYPKMPSYDKCEQIQAEIGNWNNGQQERAQKQTSMQIQNDEFENLNEIGEVLDDSGHPFKQSVETFGVRNQSRKLTGGSKTFQERQGNKAAQVAAANQSGNTFKQKKNTFQWQCISCIPLMINSGNDSSMNISYVHNNNNPYSDLSWEFNVGREAQQQEQPQFEVRGNGNRNAQITGHANDHQTNQSKSWEFINSHNNSYSQVINNSNITQKYQQRPMKLLNNENKLANQIVNKNAFSDNQAATTRQRFKSNYEVNETEEKTEVTFLNNNFGSQEPSRKLSQTMLSGGAGTSPLKNNDAQTIHQQFQMSDWSRKIRRNKKDMNARVNNKFANNRQSLPAKMQPSSLAMPVPKMLDKSADLDDYSMDSEKIKSTSLRRKMEIITPRDRESTSVMVAATAADKQLLTQRQKSISIDRVKLMHKDSQMKLEGLSKQNNLQTMQEKVLYREYQLSDLQNTESMIDTYRTNNEEAMATQRSVRGTVAREMEVPSGNNSIKVNKNGRKSQRNQGRQMMEPAAHAGEPAVTVKSNTIHISPQIRNVPSPSSVKISADGFSKRGVEDSGAAGIDDIEQKTIVLSDQKQEASEKTGGNMVKLGKRKSNKMVIDNSKSSTNLTSQVSSTLFPDSNTNANQYAPNPAAPGVGSSGSTSELGKTIFRERSKMNYEQLLEKYQKKLKNINKASKKDFENAAVKSKSNRKSKDKSARKAQAMASGENTTREVSEKEQSKKQMKEELNTKQHEQFDKDQEMIKDKSEKNLQQQHPVKSGVKLPIDLVNVRVNTPSTPVNNNTESVPGRLAEMANEGQYLPTNIVIQTSSSQDMKDGKGRQTNNIPSCSPYVLQTGIILQRQQEKINNKDKDWRSKEEILADAIRIENGEVGDDDDDGGDDEETRSLKVERKINGNIRQCVNKEPEKQDKSDEQYYKNPNNYNIKNDAKQKTGNFVQQQNKQLGKFQSQRQLFIPQTEEINQADVKQKVLKSGRKSSSKRKLTKTSSNLNLKNLTLNDEQPYYASVKQQHPATTRSRKKIGLNEKSNESDFDKLLSPRATKQTQKDEIKKHLHNMAGRDASESRKQNQTTLAQMRLKSGNMASKKKLAAGGHDFASPRPSAPPNTVANQKGGKKTKQYQQALTQRYQVGSVQESLKMARKNRVLINDYQNQSYIKLISQSSQVSNGGNKHMGN